MRYFLESNEEIFYKKPISINKNIDKEILKYSIGANLYMNGLKDIFNKIINGDFINVGSITICFEDSTREKDLPLCEENVYRLLEKLNEYSEKNKINEDTIPLIFIRVRNINQFINFIEKLNKNTVKFITGFTFPKFDSSNGKEYLDILKDLRYRYDERVYAMPIFESKLIMNKESRINELLKLKNILKEYDELILNIRVGGTDFSSQFGIRRSVNINIYDVRVVSDCLIDIVNMFGRIEDNYVIAAPVWEYFSQHINSNEIKGLLNEIKYDKENGFCGKTVVHPTQVKYVNSNYVLSFEEYIDSKAIIENAEYGGVFKGYNDNKMNEVSPHLSWAKKNIIKAKVFGVLNKGITKDKLY